MLQVQVLDAQGKVLGTFAAVLGVSKSSGKPNYHAQGKIPAGILGERSFQVGVNITRTGDPDAAQTQTVGTMSASVPASRPSARR